VAPVSGSIHHIGADGVDDEEFFVLIYPEKGGGALLFQLWGSPRRMPTGRQTARLWVC
jgi:hypothetical protein